MKGWGAETFNNVRDKFMCVALWPKGQRWVRPFHILRHWSNTAVYIECVEHCHELCAGLFPDGVCYLTALGLAWWENAFKFNINWYVSSFASNHFPLTLLWFPPCHPSLVLLLVRELHCPCLRKRLHLPEYQQRLHFQLQVLTNTIFNISTTRRARMKMHTLLVRRLFTVSVDTSHLSIGQLLRLQLSVKLELTLPSCSPWAKLVKTINDLGPIISGNILKVFYQACLVGQSQNKCRDLYHLYRYYLDSWWCKVQSQIILHCLQLLLA